MRPSAVQLSQLYSLFDVDPNARSVAEAAIEERISSRRLRRRFRALLASLDRRIALFDAKENMTLGAAARLLLMRTCTRITRAVATRTRSTRLLRNQLRRATRDIDTETATIKPLGKLHWMQYAPMSVNECLIEFEPPRGYIDLLRTLESDIVNLFTRMRATAGMTDRRLNVVASLGGSITDLMGYAGRSLTQYQASATLSDEVSLLRFDVEVAVVCVIQEDYVYLEPTVDRFHRNLAQLRFQLDYAKQGASEVASARARQTSAPSAFAPLARRSSNASSSNATSSVTSLVSTYSA